MAAIIAFVVEHQVAILSFLLALSEILSILPGVKANGIFQMIYNFLKARKASQDAPKAV